MSFFESEVIRAEMAEIQELQEEVYNKIFSFPQMVTEDKVTHVDKLERLLEKQRVFYTRLSLDMSVVFQNMNSMLKVMREQIDR